MKKNLFITPLITIPSNELILTFSRSSGAGGQNVNKVNSKVTLHWNVYESFALSQEQKNRLLSISGNSISKAGELVITSSVFRDQIRNIQDCMDKLRKTILSAIKKPKLRKKTKPKKSAKEKRIKTKKINSQKKSLRKYSGND